MSNVASLRVPAYRRHKASGQAVVTLGGRDVYLGKYRSAASQDAYKRVVAEHLLASLKQQQAPESITVVEIIAQYQRHAKT